MEKQGHLAGDRSRHLRGGWDAPRGVVGYEYGTRTYDPEAPGSNPDLATQETPERLDHAVVCGCGIHACAMAWLLHLALRCAT
jgi:hypothetical protein